VIEPSAGGAQRACRPIDPKLSKGSQGCEVRGAQVIAVTWQLVRARSAHGPEKVGKWIEIGLGSGNGAGVWTLRGLRSPLCELP
jgi:hypothetical protein